MSCAAWEQPFRPLIQNATRKSVVKEKKISQSQAALNVTKKTKISKKRVENLMAQIKRERKKVKADRQLSLLYEFWEVDAALDAISKEAEKLAVDFREVLEKITIEPKEAESILDEFEAKLAKVEAEIIAKTEANLKRRNLLIAAKEAIAHDD
jgi:hypothetical protein